MFISCFKGLYVVVLAMLVATGVAAQSAGGLIDKGWAELVKDNDTTALRYFDAAYNFAKSQNDVRNMANALLKTGICYYSASYSKGLEYAQMAMNEYKILEPKQPLIALEGRSMCLQLISTINSRQGKYHEAISLSLQALNGFVKGKDTTSYLGIIYNGLGMCYSSLGQKDSAGHYYHLALDERERTRDSVFLPTSYLAMGDIELGNGNLQQCLSYYQKALSIAENTGNRQSQVSALVCMGKWSVASSKDRVVAENNYNKALTIAASLTDKAFYRNALTQLIELKKQQGDYKAALKYKEELEQANEKLYSWDRQKAIQILEVEFDIAEKNRQLQQAVREKEVSKITGYLLAGLLAVVVLAAWAAVVFLRRINRRDKLLLQAQEALVQATEEQKKMREQHLQQEIEFKESQLSALTLQMVQKNELMQELKEKLEADKTTGQDQSINKIINKGLTQDKEWDDFNTYFESINKNFYVRLKSMYSDISPNDLKICALIKMNLSIKEMATVLNISADSVKTARYRLRKKLQLNTEDNLTAFILTL